MRKTMLAATMMALTIPATMATIDTAEAKNRHHQRYQTTDNGVRYWKGNNGRYYCKKSNGTTGLLIGGVAGALAGRAIDTNGNRATGTIVGAAAGALLGREIDRGGSRPRCR